MLRAAGFAVRELRCGKDTLRFDTAREMFRYFSATGVNGVGTCAGIWTPGRLADFERRYRAQYPDAAGGLPLTVDYLWAVAEKIE